MPKIPPKANQRWNSASRLYSTETEPQVADVTVPCADLLRARQTVNRLDDRASLS